MAHPSFTGIFGALFREIDTEITLFRNDIAIDLNVIENAMGGDAEVRFIHMTNTSNTHMVTLPSFMGNDDSPVPYLFGTKTPTNILLDNVVILEHSINDNATYRYWDGKVWRTINLDMALVINRYLTDVALANVLSAA